MSALRDAGALILDEVLYRLEQLGVSPETLEQIKVEVLALLFVIFDKQATAEARAAAIDALRGIPHRLHDQLRAAEAAAAARAIDLFERLLDVLNGIDVIRRA
jgi:hypothetical protein